MHLFLTCSRVATDLHQLLSVSRVTNFTSGNNKTSITKHGHNIYMIALFQKKNHSSSSFILNLQKNIKNIIYYEFNDTSFGIICIDKLIYKFDQSHDFFLKDLEHSGFD